MRRYKNRAGQVIPGGSNQFGFGAGLDIAWK